MFGFNWGELIVIGIVALIAIGPKELPTVLRTLGHWMGKVRRMANEFQSQFQEALREAEFADLKKHADEISSSVQEIGRMEPIAEMQKDVEQAFAETPPAAATTEPAAEALPAPGPEAPMPPPEPPAAIAADDLAPPAQKAGGGA
jgi:sec-independent protein translocase protein TatB